VKHTVLKVELEVVVTDKDIDDIVCTALEGGITYWCDETKVIGDYLGEHASDQISRGGKLKLYDYEGEAEHILTKEKFFDGVKRYCKTPTACNVLEQIDGQLRIDTCQVDANVADAIIQYALFEDVIYG